jgi:Ca2+-binding RTX toxin-like protein
LRRLSSSPISNDPLSGLGSNDTLFGHGGNDALNGGAGIDIARFYGARSSYPITRAGAVTIIGPDGTDTLSGIEKAVFDDQTVLLGQGPTRTDFNSDPKADLLWQHSNGTPVEWLMNGAVFVTGGAAGPNPGSACTIRFP